MNINNNLESHKCAECGHANISECLDLWSLCSCCSSYIISDIEVLAMDALDEANRTV